MTPTAERILAAATRIIVAEGHPALSMRRIGREIGTSAMALYRHFENREALLEAVAEAGFHRLEAALGAAVEPEGPPRTRLEERFVGYLEFALAEPHLFDLLFLSERGHIRRFPEDFERQRSRSFRLAQRDVEACLPAGTLAPEDSLEITLGLWAQAHGLVALQRVGRLGHDPAVVRDLLRRSLRRQLAALGVD